MTPQDLLKHGDTGELRPRDGEAAFADLPSAYRAALAVRARRISRGEIPRGCKVGVTNRTIWPRYNVFAPIWGSMWNTTVAACDGAGTLALLHFLVELRAGQTWTARFDAALPNLELRFE